MPREVAVRVEQKVLEHLTRLQKQIIELLDTCTCTRSDEGKAIVPNAASLFWISQWEHNEKFGFGYQLSDSSFGAMFNDETHMSLILLEDGIGVQYVEKSGEERLLKLRELPIENSIPKKVGILKYWEKSMVMLGGKAVQKVQYTGKSKPKLWKCWRTNNSYTMILDNGTLQIDKTLEDVKIVVCPLMGTISIITPNRMTTFQLSLLKKSGFSKELKQTLKHALAKLEQTIGKAQANRT